MTLQLDARQRAMLAEMGVQVWAPLAVPDRVSGAGMGQVPLPVEPVEGSRAIRQPVPQTAQPQATQGLVDARPLQTLDGQALVDAAASCQDCGLCAGRTNSTLRSAGLSPATWVVVGDPPQDDDDRAGQAFAGDAGVLLDNMLRAVGASRPDTVVAGLPAAYVTHVVKCRPPQGRVPEPTEIARCARYLDREIDLVQPRIIFAMGRFAIAALLKEHPEAAGQPLGKQRGTVYRYRGIPVVVSYAPQALMRNGADKAKAWADLCLALEQLEGSLPTMTA